MGLKKLLLLGGIVVLFSTLLGCFATGHDRKEPAPSGREKAARAALVQQLEEKYGDTVTIVSLERQDAAMAFAKDSFAASVRSERYAATFNARVDADGNNLTDDYPRLYWDEDIRERVRQALTGVEGLTDIEWKLVYPLSEQTWNPDDGLDAYLDGGKTYLDLTVTLPADLDRAAETLNALRAALQKEHLQYAVACSCGGATVVFAEKKDQPRLTEEQIYRKLERSLS